MRTYVSINKTVIILLLIVKISTCFKILGVFPAPGYSQFILGEKLMSELAKKGHEVTVISPYKPKNPLPNYKTISTEGLLNDVEDKDLFKAEDSSIAANLISLHDLGHHVTEFTLSTPVVQDLIRSKQNFDLVIVEQFADEALMGFAKHFNAPLIVFSSIGPSEWNNHILSNPTIPSVTPLTYLPYTTRMSFFKRIGNTLTTIFEASYKNFVSFPRQDRLLKKYFPNQMNIRDVLHNASLVLLNSHFSITEPYPLVPGMIEIGGFHVGTKPLPKDLQDFLDSAENGAIYFSMGTNLKSSNFDTKKLEAILDTLGKLEQKILWKFEGNLPNKPANVLISKWLPQSDILAHPNTKLFITHGGLLSMTEAVYHGVPMLGIPIFADQKMNVANAVQYGFAVHVPLQKLAEKDFFLKSITELLENRRFEKNVKERSKLLHDQQVKPLDRALYWIDYVIRHKGAVHLKTSHLDLEWYQLYLLDILLFTFILIALLIQFCRYIFKNLFKKKAKTE